MGRFLIMLILAIMVSGCGVSPKAEPVRTIVVYSELDSRFTEDLLKDYNEHNKDGVVLKAIYELKADAKPDLVIAGYRVLNNFKAEKLLQPVECLSGDSLPSAFRDKDECWYGSFYDPVVFLVNQQFARRVGQENINGWRDLADKEDVRITVQNLSNSTSTKDFLGALASHMGESVSLNYLWNINHNISQYAKFPFTPVRMTAVGDADIAITRQSFVFKYLENNFPAYVVFPKEGTPIDLYGAAVFNDCKLKDQGISFINWLISSDEVKHISQVADTGFMFLLPQGLNGSAVDPNLLWLNINYPESADQDALLTKWLGNVRFSTNDKYEEKKQ
ncbi:MAG: ABC transporter substrate-binding protein [Phascolarctobacterium sp.]|nr:ABC transporter substrate-binding protein [Phascolarctobacterium sp.]